MLELIASDKAVVREIKRGEISHKPNIADGRIAGQIEICEVGVAREQSRVRIECTRELADKNTIGYSLP